MDHLKHELLVRDIGMRNFGEHLIRTGRPLSDLEFVLLPLYMHHRFQLRSAAQSLGGADYSNAVRGDGQTPVAIVPGEEQRDALETILSALTVDFLALPEEVIALIPPSAFRHREGEVFAGRTGRLFDPIGAAEAAADFTVGEILHPARMARLVVYGTMDDHPGLEEVVDRLIGATWGAPAGADDYRMRVQHVIQRAVVDRMMRHAGRAGTMTEARAVLSDRLDRLAGRLEGLMPSSPHQRLVAADIRRWQKRIDSTRPEPSLQLPSGDPIGGNSARQGHL